MHSTKKWEELLHNLETNLDPNNYTLIFSNSKPLIYTEQEIVFYVDDIAILFIGKQTDLYLKVKNIIQSFIGSDRALTFTNDLNYQSAISQNIEDELKALNITPTPINVEEDFATPVAFTTNLRPNLTFDNYFYSYENKKIIKASNILINTIDSPEFNPFFLYGASGIGKTHLVNALGNELIKNNPALKVYYSTATDFLEEYTNLFRGGLSNVDATDSFKEKYYKLDVLILDDIQLLEGKESTLNEFFSIFEKLRTNNKLLIITSDKHPEEIHFAKRLITRFTSGLNLEISVPSSDTKKQIFNYYAHQKELNIDEQAVQIFIDNSSNIRSLLGYLNAITLYSINEEYNDALFTKEHALNLINTSTGNYNNLTTEKIIEIVADYFDLTKIQLREQTKKSKIVNARRFAAFFMHRKLKISYKQIALQLGLKEHTSAMRAVNTIANSWNTEKYKNDFDKLSNIINN